MTEIPTSYPSPPRDRRPDVSPADSSPPSLRNRLSNHPILTFVPWVVFWVVSGPRSWELASGCALLASVVLLLLNVNPAPVVARTVGVRSGPGARLQAPKILDVGTSAFFLAMVIVGFFVDRSALVVLEQYSQAISSAAFGLIVVLSIAIGHPFTEQYARAEAPPEVWDTPVFRRMMFVMSGTWAAIFFVMAILGVVAQNGVNGSGTSDILNWYIPIGLIVVGLKFNDWYPNQVMKHLD